MTLFALLTLLPWSYLDTGRLGHPIGEAEARGGKPSSTLSQTLERASQAPFSYSTPPTDDFLMAFTLTTSAVPQPRVVQLKSSTFHRPSCLRRTREPEPQHTSFRVRNLKSELKLASRYEDHATQLDLLRA